MISFLASLSLRTYLYAAVAVVFIGLGTAVKVQTSRLETAKTELATFKAEVKAAGDAAEAARQKDIVERYVISTKQEAENAKRYATLESRYKSALAAARVRPEADSSSSGTVPLSAAAPLISCPDRQPDLAGRLAELEGEILAILERGDKAIERTVTCKDWLNQQLAK